MMRLDVFLVENGYTVSRTEAKNSILSGSVAVNGKIINKPAFEVLGTESVSVDTSSKKYVSRGGLKLEGAIETFKIDVSNKKAIDIGASSGGFTDCLLHYGARHVICVDSGTNQLSEKIRNDSRITVIENYNARYLSLDDIPFLPDIAVMDVSFISATYIIGQIYNCLSSDGDFVCLIKPQFEVGKSAVGKGGIVKDEKKRLGAVERVTEYAKSVGFKFLGVIKSPIEGGDGNIEYLAYFKK